MLNVFAINLMQGALSLDIGRFFTGYGIGVFSYVVHNFILKPSSIHMLCNFRTRLFNLIRVSLASSG